MNRRTAVVVAVTAVLAAVGLVLLRSGDETERYRFDAIFDTAKGMVPGQLVKIGGVRAGTVTAVHLTATRKARMSFQVDRRHGPFREDARCRILPEGFISESFVDCDPGTRGRGPLTGARGGSPTVPITRTTVPVALQDVVDIFAVPTADRIRVLLDELGLATAGRGSDLNLVLRRANPALADARGALRIVDAQRDRLAAAVAQTDAVIARIGRGDRQLRTFVDRAATVATTTAQRRGPLAAGIRRLPATLDAVDGGLGALDRTAVRLTPLVRDLRRSAPALRTLTTSLPRFARAGTPALGALDRTARRGRGAIGVARPVVRDLGDLGAKLAPALDQLRRLLVDTRDRAGFEETLRLLYSLASVTALRDDVSHIVSIFAGVYPQCVVDRATPGCSHAYRAPGRGTIPVNDPGKGAQEATGRSADRSSERVARLRRSLRELLR